jgi:hypothetical protein
MSSPGHMEVSFLKDIRRVWDAVSSFVGIEVGDGAWMRFGKSFGVGKVL